MDELTEIRQWDILKKLGNGWTWWNWEMDEPKELEQFEKVRQWMNNLQSLMVLLFYLQGNECKLDDM
jgi:hypothetical protein